jgi:DNA-3-methyladenine glycosylase II
MKPTPSQLRSLARRDTRMGRLLKRVDPMPDFPKEGEEPGLSYFASLARSITYQQLAGKAAATIWKRACELGTRRGFPKAHELLALPMGDLRAVGLSNNKALAIQDLAGRTLDGRLSLRSIAKRTDEEVIEMLVGVRGIGEWTAQMFLMFKLGRLDVMAPGDLGLQEGLKCLDGLKERPGSKLLAQRAEDWAPLRSVACWALWRLTDLQEA